MNCKNIQTAILTLTILLAFATTSVYAQESAGVGAQTAVLLLEEADAVYHSNLARQAVGAPPLRWNAELTAAARWFSWDSVANRAEGYCGHQDSQGNWPDVRTQTAGYTGVSGAENAFCGYVSGEAAVEGWLNSEGHRANLLDPNSREVGLGYYHLADGRGYVTQDFGHDPAYAPVVINHEALSTDSREVELYIYDAEAAGGFNGRGATVDMQVSNHPTFANATWEPYTSRKTWTLAPGEAGWRTVYVKSRDQLGRTATVQDSIYFGGDIPGDALATMPLSSVQPEVTLHDLNAGGLPMMQFSLGWLADDASETFTKWWGAGERVADPQAWGGTAYALRPGDGESFAWIADSSFAKDTPLVAYFRLKVASNGSGGEVARISVKGGGVEYGPVVLRGGDFVQAGEYQEFAVPFTFHNNPTDGFLLFQIWRSGAPEVTFDAVTVFTAPESASPTYSWRPLGNYRGQGVWVRFTDGASHFSPFMEASTMRRAMVVNPTDLSLLATHTIASAPVRVDISAPAGVTWQARSSVDWVQLEQADSHLIVRVNSTELTPGAYAAVITVTPDSASGLDEQRITVNVQVVDVLATLYLPAVQR